ncbi:HNH endonuclease [Promicromonospora sp. NPDC050262]|uniref:HNH endonuclease signature motif containing protein n=1 Tax=Promicromonospora sp. NPDC050262 TaxID=3155036 RepID=UPI0033DC2431
MTTVPVVRIDDLADGKMPDDAWLAALFAEGDALFGECEPGRAPDVPAGPDWFDRAPDVSLSHGPVAVWPVEVLREALAGPPGAELAHVVAEYTGLGTAPCGGTGAELAGGPPAESAAGSAAAEAGSARLGALSDDALADLVAACVRLQSWAAGVQARVVGERAARETSPLAHDSLVGQVTAELAVTQAEGSEVVVRAESGAEHPTVIAALVQGRIDVRKAHTLLRSATRLTVAERAEAIVRYLPQAPYRTWRWLQNKLLAFAKARHGAEETARAAALDRNVQLDRAENDMGWLSAYLPAVDAAAVWGVVDDMAHQLRYTAGEERTLGQLRADCLTGIVTGRLLPGDRFAPGIQAEGSTGIVEPVSTRTPGCVPADQATVADNATATATMTATAAGTTDASANTSATDGPVCPCGGRAPVVQETVVRVTPTRPVVRVTVPASTLLGLDDAPGELDGFGPIPAETARLLAEDATWRRLVTDPVTGVLVDYSSQAYTPGKVLRAAVEARDGTCTFIGCDTPATTCDLDHIDPFDHEWRERAGAAGKNQPGQTNAWNLHALCRRHHLLKTHAGWGVERDPVTGITTWTTPAGSTHARPPTVLDTRVDLDQVDPGTSSDLTVRALTGRRLPRAYITTEPAAAATDPPRSGVPPL